MRLLKKNPQVSNPKEEDNNSSDKESESEHDSVTSENNETEKWIKIVKMFQA